jgi:hypothetical protein
MLSVRFRGVQELRREEGAEALGAGCGEGKTDAEARVEYDW